MKLYLSSQKLGLPYERLLELVGDNKNVVVVSNAIDYYPERTRKKRVASEIEMLKSIGLSPEELDLREYFGRGKELQEYLKTKSLIWVRGGNVYVLRRAMEACDFDKYILPMIKDDKIAYGGYSAAVISACNDFFASEMIDDPNIIPEGYSLVDAPQKGLGLVDFYLVPHYDSTEDWALNIKKYALYLKSLNKDVLTYCDGEVYYVNGNERKLITMEMISKERREKIEDLKKISKYVRTNALGAIIAANNGHIGGNLSSVELLTALYFGGQFNFDPNDSKNENRDRVLIRGHEGPLRYTIFSLLGYLEPEELKQYRAFNSRLPGHEDMFVTPGVDITPSGSLGMLLSYGVGSAIANIDKGSIGRTIVFLGDGEEQEGNVAEAARHAGTLGLNNLICILDQNGKQLSGSTERTDGKTDIKKVWEGYGWDVIEINNGNDIEEVLTTYDKLQNIKSPTLVIAHTVKGYGVAGAKKHFSGYHTLSSATNKKMVTDSYQRMIKELEDESLTFETISEKALELVRKPNMSFSTKETIDSSVYDIRTNVSGINLEQAQEDYLMKLKNRILSADRRSNLYMITPDLLKAKVVSDLEFKKFSHYIDTGIREQHTFAMAHGLSVENPDSRIYVYTCDAFAYRGLDQLNAASAGKSNMLVVGESAGIFQGQNGKTHQSVGQPGSLLTIPTIDFYEPADAVDLYNIFSDAFVNNNGVNYVRLHRGTVNIERNLEDMYNTGAYFIHCTDKEPKLVFLTTGFMAENAVKAAKELEIEYNIPVNVINVVNPRNFERYASKLLVNNAPIITLYNGNPQVLSQQIANAILANMDTPRPEFLYGHGFTSGATGKVDDLIKYFGFDVTGIKTLALRKMRK